MIEILSLILIIVLVLVTLEMQRARKEAARWRQRWLNVLRDAEVYSADKMNLVLYGDDKDRPVTTQPLTATEILWRYSGLMLRDYIQLCIKEGKIVDTRQH